MKWVMCDSCQCDFRTRVVEGVQLCPACNAAHDYEDVDEESLDSQENDEASESEAVREYMSADLEDE